MWEMFASWRWLRYESSKVVCSFVSGCHVCKCTILVFSYSNYLGTCLNSIFFSPQCFICASVFLQIFLVVKASFLILNFFVGSVIKLWRKVVVIRRLWVVSNQTCLHQDHIPVPDVAIFIVEKEACSITWSGSVAKILALFVPTVRLPQNTSHLYRDTLGDGTKTKFPIPLSKLFLLSRILVSSCEFYLQVSSPKLWTWSGWNSLWVNCTKCCQFMSLWFSLVYFKYLYTWGAN